LSQKIIVVGAGICGMCTALALASKGHRVVVYERDVPPPDGDAHEAFFEWNRRGASQFRHPHAFLGLLCNLLQDRYPDLMDEFIANGARKLSFRDMLPPELLAKYQPVEEDEKLWILMCRRATLETVLRRYVLRTGNIEVHDSSHITGLITEQSESQNPDSPVVKGLQLNNKGEKSEVYADLVVDASGRGTKFPQWFKAAGVEVSHEEHNSEMAYFSRNYQLKPGETEPSRHGKHRAAGDLGYIKYGVFPGDDGHFALIICVPEDEQLMRKAVRDNAQFDRMCRSIPGLEPWMDETKMQPTTDALGVSDIKAVWRHYVQDGRPLALNFFAVGDAVIRTNPLYGRGCSLGALHAHMLADILESTADPVQRALEFDKRTEEELRPIYKASLNEDKSGIKRAKAMASGTLLEKTSGFKAWFGAAFGDAMVAAIKDHVPVVRGMMRTVNLLEKPGDFLKEPAIRFTIFRYMLKGRKKNAAARIVSGPSRDEMLTMLENAAR